MSSVTNHGDVSRSREEYQDTIALLQEEIARLESELLLQEENRYAIHQRSREELDLQRDRDAAGRTLAELNAELANRDETINLLWEQVLRYEEAESANRAEWEQLQSWVEEVERRVESQGGPDLDLRAELDQQRRDADALQSRFDAQQRAWDAQRSSFESEIAELRSRLSDASRQVANNDALGALERENQRLREECRRLVPFEAIAAEVELLREHLRTSQENVSRLEQEVSHLHDELERQQVEHQAELAAARNQAARQALKPREAELSPDERIRALRQHLIEIHDQEEQERKKRQLSTKLTRLWRRTGPNR